MINLITAFMAAVSSGVLRLQSGTTTMDLSTLLQNITTIFTSIISWVQSTVNMITDNPLILLAVILPLALIAIGVVKRLLRL